MAENTPTQQSSDNKKQMLRGSFWLTAGSIMSRVLGALYIIPWVAMFGEYGLQGNALFSKGYNIYALFLMAASAGIPSAVSKLVARYNAKEEYGIAMRLYKSSLQIGFFTGLLSALILWFGAPLLAAGDPSVVPVLHSLAPAVFIIPVMSMTRGFLQGNNQMAPSAMSQFMEQLLRVIYMLLLTWIILVVNHGSWQSAVVQSTFAAFIGAIAGIAVLAWTLYKQRKMFKDRLAESKNAETISAKRLIWEVVAQAIPFVVVGSAIPFYQIIDQYTFFKIMQMFTNLPYAMLNTQYAIFDFNANKLIMIVISLAVAMGSTAIPLLAAAHAKDDNQEISEQVRFTLELFSVVMIPAAIGMAAIAQPLYVTFYGYNDSAMLTLMGTTILQFSSFLGIMFGLFTLLSTITQGLSRNREALQALGIGLIVKLALQVPMVALLGAMGTLVASFLGFVVSSLLVIRQLQNDYDLKLVTMTNTLSTVIAASIAMGAVAYGTTELALHFLSPEARIIQILIVAVAVALGGAVYAFLILRSPIAEKFFGARAARLRTKLHIR
ncbi:polysaccharide biosynthesis protein [Periweissella cryptocerci]|uniref:Polysaccharide biosynthesis protein n=1 Tax=Periweissella cryptocerci TaxID=2506420 RepID=A0A4P6YSU7_9LACO|nr:polysaccharide biosynthesis protein [Periweissella cryptocerci]QBO35703.1 polysaccharide biosynthesis protein [Periweissella cryptocerci]